jgi:hypothetical protein
MALGQARSAFMDLDGESGILVHRDGPMGYTLQLGANPTVTLDGHIYDVAQVFGFWALSNGGDLAASGTDQNGWGVNQHSNDVAGWSNPNKQHAVLPGHGISFVFDGINSAAVHTYGVHVQVAQSLPDGGNTFHGSFVPDPSGLVALATGIASLVGMRMRRR